MAASAAIAGRARAGALKQLYWSLARRLRRWRDGLGDFVEMLGFIRDDGVPLPRRDRIELMRRFAAISRRVKCAHTQAEMIAVARSILALPRGANACLVEAGCFRGGSGAKLSLLAALTGRTLYLFDSFEGIPVNDEEQISYGKRRVAFQPGEYAGSLDEVRGNIGRFGAIASCRFVRGWFSDTMPGFGEPVGVAFIDVDLVSSTRDCLRNLYPRLIAGGAIYSQDAHLSGVASLLADDGFWREEVGVARPRLTRVASPKLMRIDAPA